MKKSQLPHLLLAMPEVMLQLSMELNLSSCSFSLAEPCVWMPFVASMMLINLHHMESVALIGQGLGASPCGQTGQE